MNIVIENIGPIRKAQFDLDKRLSVFCGPNNTGKTYLSYILYAFTRRRIYLPDDMMTDAQVNAFIANRVITIPMDTQRIYKVMSERMSHIKKDLGLIFGLSDQNAKKLFPKFKLVFDVTATAYQAQLIDNEYEVEIVLTRNVTAKVTKRHGSSDLTVKNLTKVMDESDRNAIKYDLMTTIYHYLILSPIYDSHFFPVERTSMYAYHKDIQGTRNKLIDILHSQGDKSQQQAINFVMSNSSQFPLVISQMLDAAGNMGRMKNEEGFYKSLADEIEGNIIHGKVSVTDEGDMRFASEKAPEKIVPIQLSASMDKAISGIVFYLRHTSSMGDMVFIDEPEVNCHPNVQVLLTRIFAKMVNAGLRLVISTHSDYIIRELNNLMMLSGASKGIEDKLNDWGYTPEMALHYEDVAAYMFAYGKDNVVDVKPIAVTDSGFEVSTIDDTISQMNEISQALYYELRYGKK